MSEISAAEPTEAVTEVVTEATAAEAEVATETVEAPAIETEAPTGTVEAPAIEAPAAETMAPLEFFAPPAEASKPKPRRKFPWRWVGAVVTMAAVGTGCAFAVMAPQRTDLPGLKTAADGRYDFAPLVLPTLAPGQSDPSSDGNNGRQHISDIRKLLLAPPEGAALDGALPGASGWVSNAATLQVLANPTAAEQLQTDGWRHTAGVSWKTPDGAETKIWLVQFIDSSAASDADPAFSMFDGGTLDPFVAAHFADDTDVDYVRVVKGSTATWYGQAQVDDAEILIEFTAPKSVGIAPFEQEMDLQIEMLQ